MPNKSTAQASSQSSHPPFDATRPLYDIQRVTFVGDVHFASGEHVGIELEDACGDSNGTVEGKTYFNCEPKVISAPASKDIHIYSKFVQEVLQQYLKHYPLRGG